MFKKSTLTIAATLTATLAVQSSAFATDTTSNIRDHRKPVISATVRDHRTTRKNEVVIVNRKDCSVGYNKLESRGFENIRVQDCTGMKYRYFAKRNGTYYIAKMHAYSGSVELQRLGIIHTN